MFRYAILSASFVAAFGLAVLWEQPRPTRASNNIASPMSNGPDRGSTQRRSDPWAVPASTTAKKTSKRPTTGRWGAILHLVVHARWIALNVYAARDAC